MEPTEEKITTETHLDADLSNRLQEIFDEGEVEVLKVVSPSVDTDEEAAFLNGAEKIPALTYPKLQDPATIEKITKYIERLESFKQELKATMMPHFKAKETKNPEYILALLYLKKVNDLLASYKGLIATSQIKDKRQTAYSRFLFGDANPEEAARYNQALDALVEEKRSAATANDGAEKGPTSKPKLSGSQIAEVFNMYLQKYGWDEWKAEANSKVAVVTTYPQTKTIAIPEGFNCTYERVIQLLAGQLKTRVFTQHDETTNPEGKRLALLKNGPGYENLLEGMVMHHEGMVSDESNDEFTALLRASAVGWARTEAPTEVFKKINSYYKEYLGLKEKTARKKSWDMYKRLYRGTRGQNTGAYSTRLVTYQKGLELVNGYLEHGLDGKTPGKFEDLFIGKISLDDLERYHELGFKEGPEHRKPPADPTAIQGYRDEVHQMIDDVTGTAA
ncbi:DUF1704 domain-containing protein [Candidatus Gracilibacteria bacterium]|nr:DUF1704 domain-containing protein [Candidatus Gracilibacteria bacterium]